MGKEDMRGLQVYIADIRACKSEEAEQKRINKELANIRSKFADKKGLNGYQKKKYICKLVFTFLLGHDVEFGHLEAVNLLSSLQYSEKQMGYLFVSVMMNEQHELMRLVNQAIKTDLTSRNELHVSLALHCISNVGGKETATATLPLVTRLCTADESPTNVKKKACLALLRLYREDPEQFPRGEHTSRLIQLITSPDAGVVTAAASLLTKLSQDDPEEFRGVVAHTVNRLHRIVLSSLEGEDYVYYSIPAPWLTVKLLRLLQIYPYPTDGSVAGRLDEAMNRILARSQQPPPVRPGHRPKVQYFNVNYACLFELINLLCHYDSNAQMLQQACQVAGGFLSHKEVNMRFLALESLSVLALSAHAREEVKKHENVVLRELQREKDPTVQSRAVDVLYALCDHGSVTTIVEQLLSFLARAEYSIREDLVLKIAILAEKYVTDFSWYVDVMLRLIRLAGDQVQEQVWHRVIQVIINRPDAQDYAAKTCYEALLDPAAHETMICVAGYVLGEFGHLIANDPNSSPQKQIDVLQMHYPMVSAKTRALLITSFIKLANIFPEMKPAVKEVLSNPTMTQNSDSELQQRANEYLQLLQVTSDKVMPAVLEEMPPFNENQSSVLMRLEDKKMQEASEATGSLSAKKRAAQQLQAVTAEGHTGAETTSAQPEETVVGNDQFFSKFYLVNDGILYENPVLQIAVKSEFHTHLGRLTLYWSNRGDTPMTEVYSRVHMEENPEAVKIDADEAPEYIGPQQQLQQAIRVECVSPFSKPPVAEVSLNYQGRSVVLQLKLPVLLNKFFEPLTVSLNAQTFGQKWNQLGGPPREAQQVVKAHQAVDQSRLVQRLTSFGLPILDSIDPNPQNKACAAILRTSSAQIGALLRAEPDTDSQTYRFTLRTSSDLVTRIVLPMLASQF